MEGFLPGWTMERVTLLAPDAASAQSGRKLANPRDDDWKAVASDGFSAWAVYQDKGKSPYHVKVDLLKLRHDDKVWDCDCRTYKSPCQHVLALLYMLVDEPEEVMIVSSPPHQVEEWLDKEAISARKREERKKRNRTVTPEKIEQRKKQFAKRKKKVSAGLAELEQWLINMVRRGLADPQVRSYGFWDSRAARMVDAQAPGIATWIHSMGSIPVKGTDWIEPLLDQLGRLFLLIESFKRYDELAPEIQADLRAVLGWHMKRDEVVFYDAPIIKDTWIVTGRYAGTVHNATEQRNGKRGLKTQRVWLRGLQSGRDALILDFSFGDSLFETYMLPGWSIEAEMNFYPSRYPLRAFINEKYSDVFEGKFIEGESIIDNIENYAHALSENPWIQQFPFVLEDVIPVNYENKWILREVDGRYLPIDEQFEHRWSLLALSGGHSIQVAGEWNGTTFYPTGAMVNQRFVDFEVIGKL